ncbi:MAG: hypothetical protein Q9220_005100 [cf. Caloplaca sp. 1 TL-2023]
MSSRDSPKGLLVPITVFTFFETREPLDTPVFEKPKPSSHGAPQTDGATHTLEAPYYGTKPTASAHLDDDRNRNMLDQDSQAPLCNRCHGLIHHNVGHPITHPTLQSVFETISASPYSYNHIYHIVDAADFPMSLIPQLQRRLDLSPQRSQNRRSQSRAFSHGHRAAEMSFIITRSDLLAPQKEQVDALMPYLVQVLRNALGSSGRNVRLGNVHCVSANRGWWTKQIKDDIWGRGGGGWMVGKVNVGKSKLIETVFPKRRSSTVGRSMAPEDTASCRAPSERRVPPQHNTVSTTSLLLLPPPQPERQFPIMPTVSQFAGTTASPIRIPFGNGKGELIDLPGFPRGSLEDHIVPEQRSDLLMRQRVKPEQLVIKSGQSLLIAGLVRITPTTPGLVVLAYPFVPLAAYVTSTDKAIAISNQTQSTGNPSLVMPGTGAKMALAGSFQIRTDVTRMRAGPLTASSAAALSTKVLPFTVFSTDVLIEGCGWVELVAQVRKRDLESDDARTNFPAVKVWSPNGDYIAERQPMNGWLLGNPKAVPAGKRPRRSMKGVKKGLKQLAKVQQIKPQRQGAAVLPRDIKRIHLEFAFRINDGHFGARKVWRDYLPRLKYHNPAVSMTVNRSEDQKGPAALTVYYNNSSRESSSTATTTSLPSSSGSSSESTTQDPFERMEIIDMKHRHESEILRELLDLTKATPVVATAEEEAELEMIAEEEKRGEMDRARNAAYTQKKRQEKALLDQARGAVAGA